MKSLHIFCIAILTVTLGCSGQAAKEPPKTDTGAKPEAAKPEAAKTAVAAPEQERLAASHILISHKDSKNVNKEITRTKEEALVKIKEALTKLKAGEDFAKTAKEFSDCNSSTRGGEIGTVAPGMMPPTFVEGLKALEIGKISEPVESPLGYHLIRRDEPVKIEMFNASFIAILHKDSNPNPINATRTKEEALAKAKEAMAKLKEGADFGKVASEYSDHPNKARGGLMGDFQSDRVPPEILRGVKPMEVGQFSTEPYETPIGFYIFKRNPLSVPMAIAMILVAHKDSDPNQFKQTRTKEEAIAISKEVIAKLEGGADFGELAKQYSDLPNKDNGGNMGVMSSDALPLPIFEAVNSLKIDEYSKEPFEQPIGYHVFLRRDPAKVKQMPMPKQMQMPMPMPKQMPKQMPMPTPKS